MESTQDPRSMLPSARRHLCRRRRSICHECLCDEVLQSRRQGSSGVKLGLPSRPRSEHVFGCAHGWDNLHPAKMKTVFVFPNKTVSRRTVLSGDVTNDGDSTWTFQCHLSPHKGAARRMLPTHHGERMTPVDMRQGYSKTSSSQQKHKSILLPTDDDSHTYDPTPRRERK